MTDPIADLLTRIRNAIAAQHPKVDIPHSRLKGEVARILKEEGYITNYRSIRISRAGKRFWVENATIWTVTDPTGIVLGQAATFSKWTPIVDPT